MDNTLPKAPQGYDVIAWITHKLDCCVDKIIDEYSKPMQQYKLTNLVVHESKVGDIMNYVPKAVVCFRSGAGEGGCPDKDSILKILANLRNLRVKTFYYTDDLIFGANNWAPMQVINMCDEVIVSSDAIYSYLKSSGYTRPIHLLETHMDIDGFDKVNPDTALLNPDKFRIMWTSSGRLGVRMLNELISRMDKNPETFKDVQIVMASGGVAQVRSVVNHFRNVDKVYLEWMEKNKFYSYCKACNLILACGEVGDLDYFLPAEFQKPWMDSKSPVKYCIAGAARIPIIAQPMAMYAKAIKNGETGFIANSVDEFIELITKLKDDPGLRDRIGNAAREDIVANYDINKRCVQLVDILTSKVPLRSSIAPTQSMKSCWLPEIAGGPKTFHNTIKKYLPKISRGKWSVVHGKEAKVDAAIIPAFIGVDRIDGFKQINPDCRIIARVDGLPMDFEGNLQYNQLEMIHSSILKADSVVWQSLHCREIWKEHIDVSKGSVIHNGVDLEIFSSKGDIFQFPGSRLHILCVNFSTFPHKRRDIVEEVIKLYPDIMFHIVGHYVSVDQNVEKSVWSKYSNVDYLGPIYNNPYQLAKLYRGSSAILFTSEMEGSPNTVLEAMACGCPVIYNANSSIVPEVLGDLGIGFIDPKEFDDKIYKLRDTAEVKLLRYKLETRAELYSAEICTSKYLRLMEGKTILQPNLSQPVEPVNRRISEALFR